MYIHYQQWSRGIFTLFAETNDYLPFNNCSICFLLLITAEMFLLHLFIAGSLRVLSPVSGIARFSTKSCQKVYRPEICTTGTSIGIAYTSLTLLCSAEMAKHICCFAVYGVAV